MGSAATAEDAAKSVGPFSTIQFQGLPNHSQHLDVVVEDPTALGAMILPRRALNRPLRTT